jgi:hypothetical protein
VDNFPVLRIHGSSYQIKAAVCHFVILSDIVKKIKKLLTLTAIFCKLYDVQDLIKSTLGFVLQ